VIDKQTKLQPFKLLHTTYKGRRQSYVLIELAAVVFDGRLADRAGT